MKKHLLNNRDFLNVLRNDLTLIMIRIDVEAIKAAIEAAVEAEEVVI